MPVIENAGDILDPFAGDEIRRLFAEPEDSSQYNEAELDTKTYPAFRYFFHKATAMIESGKEMVDFIADYLENIREKRVFPDVKPGYLRNLIPDCAPQEAEPWAKIFDDVENFIVPGLTHWQSPHMHGYFSALNSPASILGDMLSGGFNCLGFTWAASPACTELETVVMNWLGKMLNLPKEFLHTNNEATSLGGGVIQTTMSEATFVTILAARKEATRKLQNKFPSLEESEINSRLVAYCSDQAHSSVEKASLMSLVKLRLVESDENLSMRGDQLMETINKDKEKGYILLWKKRRLCHLSNSDWLNPMKI
ncbi:unnamed protein product [Notodromas monacha]|uniref:Histidine decarboxylase n=1 Tax=Notodromas monacha TaxID=399045 RepID=A0A7R9GFI4_9CRUS|nr:unnamed protein product [Notodromas monacha]CAG0919176.1 unnamed protein product [Notodromas monacha]